MRNLEVHFGHQLDTCNLRNNGECIWVFPDIVDEGRVSFVHWLVQNNTKIAHDDLLISETPQLTLCQITGVLAIIPDGLAEDLCPHAFHSFFGEQLKWF